MSWSKDKYLVLLAVTGSLALQTAQSPAFSETTAQTMTAAAASKTTETETSKAPDTWESLTNSAVAKTSAGDHRDAEQLLNQANDLAKTFASDDSRRIRSVENLAEAIEQQGRYTDALELYQDAFRLRKTMHGESSDRLSKSYFNIGRVQRLAGDYSKARTNLKKALDLRQFSSSDEANQQDIALIRILYNLGILETETGEFKNAEEHLNRAQSIAQHLAKHKENAQIFSKLALLSIAEGDLPKAENQAETSFSMAEKFGKGDKLVKAEALDSVAMAQLARGNFKKASAACDEALGLKHDMLGFHHPVAADTLVTAGLVKIAEKKYDAAEMKFDDAIAVYNHANDRSQLSYSHALIGRSIAHLKQKDKTAASEDLEKAFTIMKSVTGIDSHLSAKYAELFNEQQGNNLNVLKFIEKLRTPNAVADEKFDLFGELMQSALDDGHSDELISGIRYKDLMPVLGIGFVVIVLIAMAVLMPGVFSRLFPWGKEEDHATMRNKNRGKQDSTNSNFSSPEQKKNQLRSATDVERKQAQVWKGRIKTMEKDIPKSPVKSSGAYDRIDFKPSSQEVTTPEISFKQNLSTPVQPEGSTEKYW